MTLLMIKMMLLTGDLTSAAMVFKVPQKEQMGLFSVSFRWVDYITGKFLQCTGYKQFETESFLG